MSELLSIALFLASIAIYTLKAGHHRGWFIGVLIVLAFFIILNITQVASDYFTGDGINDAVLYTLTSSLSGAGMHKYILPGLGLVAVLLAVFWSLTWLLRRRKNHPHHHGYSLLALLLALASVDASPAFHQISALVKSQSQQGDPDFVHYYREPAAQLEKPGPNLVYIYAESLERTYLNNDAFPDLTPELGALQRKGLDFSQTQQLPGTGYTIAGMVASQCGIPLFAPFEGNASSSVSSFFPHTRCLGDILKNSGYQNYFIQGASLRFAGKDVFLRSHGFDHLYGADELKTTVADPHYRNDWGFYDDVVLDQVWQKFQQLSAAGQPFSLFTLTVDTHHPDGFISRGCQRKQYLYQGKENRSFSAVTCSQQLIAGLLEKIENSPWFDNTIVVVSSDHLAMNNTAWKYLNQQPRSNLFFVLRGDKPQAPAVIDAPRSSLDNGATVLDILGGEKVLGLGRSSLSEPSLTATIPNIKQKIDAWKPAIIGLWNFPKTIDKFTVDSRQQSISFSGSRFQLPLLLRVSENKIEPIPESEYSAPLRYQLANFAPGDNFVWVDRCFKMARLWAPQFALSTDYCVAQGYLGGTPTVAHVDKTQWSSTVKLPPQRGDITRYQQNIEQLKIDDNAIRYQANSFLFNVPGAPSDVARFDGLSRSEIWGRWSNANINPHVSIEYQTPLPAHFELEITARAFGPNIGAPVPVTVGNQTQQLLLSDTPSTTRLRFDNPALAKIITLTPPAPQATNEGNILGHAPRKLGVGLIELRIIPQNDTAG